MSAANVESRRVCPDCMTGAHEKDLCARCQHDFAGDRAGRALVEIAIAGDDWDGDPEGYMKVDLVHLGYLMIDALITPSRCPGDLVRALEHAGFTRGPGIADLTEEQRQERVAAAIDEAVERCPDDLGHVPGPGRPI